MKNKQYKNSLEEEGLSGPVKQLKLTTYEVVKRDGRWVPGKLSESSFHNQIQSFDEAGMAWEQRFYTPEGLAMVFRNNEAGDRDTITHYDENGEVESIMTFYYDANGEQTGSREEHPGKASEKLWTHERTLDERGLLIKYHATLDGAPYERRTYTYDDAGRQTEQQIYDKHDKLQRRIETSYATEGLDHTDRDYDGAGKLTSERTAHYDAAGEYTGSTTNGVFEAYKPPARANEYKYDHHGNWIEEADYHYSGDSDRPEYIRFRRISYYGEASAAEALSMDDTIYDMAAIDNPIPPAHTLNTLSPQQWQWIAEGGERHEPFAIYRYYTALHGFFPATVKISSYEVELWSLRRYLIASFGAAEVWVDSDQQGNLYDEAYRRYVLAFPRNKYLLEADNIQHLGTRQYIFRGKPADPEAEPGNWVQFGAITLYHPPGAAGGRDEDFEDELRDVIDSFKMKKAEEVPQISMVTVLGTSFSLKAYPVKDDFIIKDLELNYGSGFETFHKDLMERFGATKQGLILFHGAPGTGKTFYIRHLLRRMSESKKVVIYMPPNMVDHLVEPSFMSFISGQVSLLAAGGKSCVLLIEDAEPLLVARDENTRIQGITNLLNMTDGLLNDMLGLQIICTFNVALKQLDKALLRPGRLIARKEFKALPEFEANVLAHSLGIKHVFTKPATLGEIYAMAPDKKMLMHDA